jgi:glycine/D-amino acid oxidase-like deaminating enzyme/nitrite reductase/ring-hydroxylating ferredoxin subunit
MRPESLWRKTSTLAARSAALPREVDVLVVGGGITGLTAAYLLARSGKRVAVVERERIGSGETGNTSAHLTQITDLRITELADRFGRDAARLAWEGGEVAIDLIESIVEREGIECEFARVPGWLSAPFFDSKDDGRGLPEDAELAAELGFRASYRHVGPIGGRPAMVVADQGLIHPLRYLGGLAAAAEAAGVRIVEHAQVSEVLQDPLVAVVNGQNVACGEVIIATHVPIVGSASLVSATLLQTKLYPHSSYVVGARIDEPVAPGSYNDTSSPYRYLRVHRDAEGAYAIFGGADHKTGTVTDTAERFGQVQAELLRLLPSARIEARWTGQVIETSDGLPFVGETAPHQYASTGYAGNGLTFGTLGALVMHDAVMGVDNPWRSLLDPNRKELSAGVLATVVAQNLDYPFYFIADRLRRDRTSTVRSLKPGDAKVLTIGGKPVACHRTESGELLKVSAVCTHMGCLVRWNQSDRTWDCPCHGSRFTPEGLVLGGPAEAELEKMD